MGFRKTLFSDALGRLEMGSSDRVTAPNGTTANALDKLLEPGGAWVECNKNTFVSLLSFSF